MMTRTSLKRLILCPLALAVVVSPVLAGDTEANALTIDLPPIRPVRIPSSTNSLTMETRAEAGDATAQSRLAEGLLGNRVFGRFEQNPVEAYKWASIASSQGNKDAACLLKECDLFLSAADRAKGKSLAMAYFAEHEQKPTKSDTRTEGGTAP